MGGSNESEELDEPDASFSLGPSSSTDKGRRDEGADDDVGGVMGEPSFNDIGFVVDPSKEVVVEEMG